MAAEHKPMNLIFGCGYLGERVAALWEQNSEVAAVTRSQDRANKWRDAGRTAVVADVTQPATLESLPRADVVLWAVGLDRAAGPSMRDVYVGGLANVLAALSASPPRRFVYASSTSVHGMADGPRIDEHSSCTPDRENGRICLEAENLLQASSLGDRAIILRLAGIYGPGRLPNIAKLAGGEALATEPEHRLNLIHVDDAARAVLAAADQSVAAPDFLLVADGQPPTRREFYTEAARLWQTPPPTFDAEAAARSRSRSNRDKRIENAKLRRELLPDLLYPDYRAGLKAIWETECGE